MSSLKASVAGERELSPPVIVAEEVTKRFRTPGHVHFPSPRSFRFRFEKPTVKVALEGVSLAIPRGEIFGFLGPNGAGKTTLIKTIVGLLAPTEGRCLIRDADGRAFDSHTREAKLKLGYLPEQPYYHEFLTAEEFLLFHGRLLGLDDKEILAKVPPLLKRVGLTQARHQKLETFSKGMLQRVGLAQALIHDPDILVLDEPMSGLDPIGRREVREIITAIGETGKTIFFSTHIIHDVEVICTTVGYIREGVLMGAGPIDKLLGKTVRSMEIRFSLADGRDPREVPALKQARKTMDGWVIEVEADANRLEYDVQEVLRRVLDGKGTVRSVVPRRSTLEDLLFTGSAPL
ncbi:MAG: ABC transporter ATP-binding protein [Deltaproteobacteria bacterium]|nr:ABC transporter ATP-binding protein [Deltaproteobacteria bacterium]